ncbi:hypothetical protein P9112_001558 [Eukaryota sp. TZLM1-RC]
MKGFKDFYILDKYLKYIIEEIDLDSASNKISNLLKGKLIEPPFSPIVCAPDVSPTPFRNSGKTQQPPSTSFLEVPAENSQQISQPMVETPSFSEIPAHITNTLAISSEVFAVEVSSSVKQPSPSVPAPSSEVSIMVPFPVFGQTLQQVQQTSSIPLSERIICASQPIIYQQPST